MCPKSTYSALTLWILTVLFLSSYIFISKVQAQSAFYQMGKSSWKSHDYESAYNYLMEFRSQPYGRLPEVDYMIGTSACRLPEKGTLGARILHWMLYAYPLGATSHRIINSEINNCQALQTAIHDVEYIENEISAGMYARGKTFYWVDREIPVNSYPARFLKKINRTEFETRLFDRQNEDEVKSYIQNLYPEFQLYVSSRFVLASNSGHPVEALNEISHTLESFMDFLIKQYNLSEHEHFITIYLVPNITQLQTIANDLHYLDVSPATIGYSFIDDLSVVAVIPGTTIGTLLHELFHLTVRRDFGDIPQWLDEGMASLYEVCEVRGIDFIGIPNWRGEVLQKLWHLKPELEELISSKWFAFDMPSEYEDSTADEEAVLKQAALTAMGRYFILYLQDKGKLVNVFKSFKESSFCSLIDDINEYKLLLLQAGYGEPFSVIDQDFQQWLLETIQAP